MSHRISATYTHICIIVCTVAWVVDGLVITPIGRKDNATCVLFVCVCVCVGGGNIMLQFILDWCDYDVYRFNCPESCILLIHVSTSGMSFLLRRSIRGHV